MNTRNLALATLFCSSILASCSESTPTKTTELQDKQSSSKVTVPSWYHQHKNVKAYQGKYVPLFSGSLLPDGKSVHTIESTIEYHAIGVVMYGKSNTQGEVGFTQLNVNGPCGKASPVKSGGDMLGGFGSCSPKDGKIQIEVFNQSDKAVEYVVYDGQKAKEN